MSKNNENFLYSTQHKIEWVKLYYYKENSFSDVSDQFHLKHSDIPKPSPSTIQRLIRKFETTGSVENLKPPGRPRTATDDDTSADVLAKVSVSPVKSSSKLGAEVGISSSSAYRILIMNKYHPYKVQLVQKLTEDDFDRRVEFCQWAVKMCDSDPDFSRKVVFSDEAIFYLNGHVNRQSTRFWSGNNPHWSSDIKIQGDPRVMVWCGIWNDRIIGPYFFDKSVTGATYLELLQDKIWPEIELFHGLGQVWFQQDGAPAHYHKDVRQWLDMKMPGRWIGRRGPREWAPRSPDLTIPDFFLWGYLKSQVYNSKPRNIQELMDNIRDACRSITSEMLKNCREEWEMRIKRIGYTWSNATWSNGHLVERATWSKGPNLT